MLGWDYAGSGKYFVTICTHNRICCFGDVVQGEMRLNEMGYIVRKYWMEIRSCFANTYLDEFQIMPDHVHGIIVMKRSRQNVNKKPEDNGKPTVDLNCAGHGRDETRSRLYMSTNMPEIVIRNKQMAEISPKPGSLSVIIGGWKSKCTKEFKETEYTWQGWQSRFHDSIIRNDRDLQRIRQYIRSNPENWNGYKK